MAETLEVQMTFTVTVSHPVELVSIAKVIGHPTRLRIIERLRDDGRASPSELAVVLDEPLGNVSYHVRELLQRGAIELVETAPRRGAVEHYYELSERGRMIAFSFSVA